MRTISNSSVGNISALALFSLSVWACGGSEPDTDTPNGGSPSSTAGSPGAGTGASSAGTASSGGMTGVSGHASVGGAGAASGGSPGVAGTTSGVAGSSGSGSSTGGSGSGGNSSGGNGSGGNSSGGSGGGSATAGAATGGSGSTDCVKGSTKGKDVAVIGESFIALSHGITKEIEKLAKAAGSLPQGESYVDKSVSGTTLANNQIPSQYDDAVKASGTIKYVVMDGGGNDCLINNNGYAALTAATTLFKTMADKKTEKIMYFFYPDPIGSNYASLKTCLDALRPKMKALCDGLTAPKCTWLDLRPTWNGHNEYTSDGIHPTDAGSAATAAVVWDSMKSACIAQ